MKFRSLVCISIFLLGSTSQFSLFSQNEYQVKTFTTENGLSHNVIFSIAQDQTGFLWITSWEGLSRFDGNEFRNYFHKPDDSSSLPFFIPSKVLVDSKNIVWIFTQGRPVVVYDRAVDCFKSPFTKGLSNLKINDIVTGWDNNVWLSTDTAIIMYCHETAQLKSFRITIDSIDIRNSLGQDPLLLSDNKGAKWLCFPYENQFHLFRGTFKDGKIFFHRFGTLPVGQYSSSRLHDRFGIIEIYISLSGKTWVFSKYGLFCHDPQNGLFVKHEVVDDTREFNGKRFFHWTDDVTGVNFIDTGERSVINLKTKNNNYAECVFIDRAGIVWTGDINPARDGVGLNRYIKVPDYFKHYLTERNENNTLNLVFPILKDRNRDLWVGTRYLNYLFRISSDGSKKKVYLPVRETSRDTPKARCMAEDSGGIWFGTTERQLIRYDLDAGNFDLRNPAHNDIAPPPGIHNILYNNGSLIINGEGGVYRADPEKRSMNLYYRHEPPGTGFSLVADGTGGFWLGTWSSRVIHLDSDLKKTSEFRFGNGEDIVEHICVGDSNDIWVALMGGGLGHLFPETGIQEIFTTADGLSNNVTYSIIKDYGGSLWISTNNGLSRFNPHSRQFRNYAKPEGLLISEFNSGSYYQASDGELFFGGIGGLVGFYPDSIDLSRQENYPVPLILTGLKVSGIDRHLQKALYESDTIRLNKGEDNFQLTFAAIDFKGPEKIKYRYRVIGEDDNWIETDYRNRSINYAHLTHGDYALELEATDYKGDWVVKKAFLIRIPPRLTERLAVRISLVLIFLAVISFGAVSYTRQLEMKNRLLNDQLRLESLRGQMNPHFIFNSLSSINYFISRQDKVSANNYIADFSRLIRSFLNNLACDYIPFEKELESLRDYLRLEHLRFGDRFEYIVNADEILSKEDLIIFPGLIQPFVENAIWHGVRGLESGSGRISIDFMMVSRIKIRCVVEDNGIGMKQSRKFRNNVTEHHSRGIEIVRERLRIFNNMTKGDYDVKIEDLNPWAEDTGTKVILDIPVKRSGAGPEDNQDR